jgi:hypothetical protein
MPLFQPILSHKIACVGRSQARIFEAWGNFGKCEIVGVPRFDRLLHRQARVRKKGEPWTPLILTAKTPGFTPEQMQRTRQSLAELKAWFDSHPHLGEIPIRPRWRITGGLDEDIGVPNELRDTTGDDLASALEQVDAVITTPSTSMLEGMLQGIPVALLDPHNCPHFIPAAWTITAREHVDQVLLELVDPPEAKRLYQQSILHDALECHTAATPRLALLIETMSEIARGYRAKGQPIQFPDRMLQDNDRLQEVHFDLRKLYPDHPVYSVMDRAILQTEIGHCLLRMNALEIELEQLRQGKALLWQTMQQQMQMCEDSLSFRLGRAITWPLRKLARFAR